MYANAGGQGIRPRDVQSRTIAEEACCDSLTHTLSHTLPLLQPPCFLHSLSMEDRAFQAYNYSNKSPSAHATHWSLINTHTHNSETSTYWGLSLCAMGSKKGSKIWQWAASKQPVCPLKPLANGIPGQSNSQYCVCCSRQVRVCTKPAWPRQRLKATQTQNEWKLKCSNFKIKEIDMYIDC